MDAVRTALLGAAALGMVAVSSSAYAHGKRFHHHPRSHLSIKTAVPVVPRAHFIASRPRARVGVGVHFGVPVFAPPYYYPPYYHYPRYYYPAPAFVYPAPVYHAPPVYIEQHAGAPQAAAEPESAYWFYCRDSQAYYPHVQQCASAWERVIPHSPIPPAQ
jgi:hypothetical protein